MERREHEPLVSIVVPVYNGEAFIEETILSIRGQSFENWELLAVDDASRDGTWGRLEELAAAENRMHAIRLESNQGAAEARNVGIRQARGRYLCFLDGDDLWLETKLERQLAFMQSRQAAFSFTGYAFGDAQARPTGAVVIPPEALGYKEALRNTCIFTSTVMFDLEKLPKAYIVFPRVKSEDTALWWEILRRGYTAYGLGEPLSIYRRPQGSLSSNKLEAIRRIWHLYRRREGLSVWSSLCCGAGWALGAVRRRLS